MTFDPPTIDDLALDLNDSGIREDRAQSFIDQAVTRCEVYCQTNGVDWPPPLASIVIRRVAARAYTATMSPARAQQMAEAGSPLTPGMGGVWLTRLDKSDLRTGTDSGGGAFTVNMLANYTGPPYLPRWDSGVTTDEVAQS